MTVEELIEELKKCPPYMIVVTKETAGTYSEVTSIQPPQCGTRILLKSTVVGANAW
jgi:hypothetical protein